MKGIDTSFFRITADKQPVTAGGLLVAEPFLSEQWFDRAVISLIDHSNEEGTTGVVLNNPLATTLDEVLDGVKPEAGVRVYCGGPLSQDRLFFVHTLGDEVIPEARMYADGMWIGGDFDAAIQYVNSGYPVEDNLRFFIGYSGWTPGQLAEEIEAGTWAVQPDASAVEGILSDYGDTYWHRVVRSLGERYRIWSMLPRDIKAN